MKFKTLLLSTLIASPFAIAHDHSHDSELEIHGAYARAVPAGAPASAAFMQIENNSDKVRTIVAASTPAAGIVELHNHVKVGDVMKMRTVKSIDIPANSSVELKPGSLHVMFFELNKEFKDGDKIELTLEFANGDKRVLDAPIKPIMKGMKHKH
ncbi:copper chaperone PCu(A)C [Vibrio sp. SCSIO 43136]|uniref:copper chaperone PCu(A)C n=1 Tax=Vibrio sp. SCSIO 43136 TaxID=2819101 RepID=UPI0020764669|nr:copper chaperone PCu(A)C [Vibrio sp. SCSIO 43136]USD67633.1 copper chaperone PCu(A)C [Vibrio sp. SCSIO 43136]